MPYYGDISGDFRDLINGGEEYCVVGVVGGPEIDCVRCAKRAVRRVQNMTEAKWYEMQSVEKRRFFDCFDENTPPLSYGYATFKQEDFETLESYHHLYRDVVFPPVWDIALRAFAYIEILFNMGAREGPTVFKFDRFASGKQSDALADLIESRLNTVSATHHSSRQVVGIQSADCLAGGVREQFLGGEPWLDHISPDESITDCKHWTLIQLEKELSQV